MGEFACGASASQSGKVLAWLSSCTVWLCGQRSSRAVQAGCEERGQGAAAGPRGTDGLQHAAAGSPPRRAVEVQAEAAAWCASSGRWGLWNETVSEGGGKEELPGAVRHVVRLCLRGTEVAGTFEGREQALAFQAGALQRHLGWPRQALSAEPVQRDPLWDHPEELEPQKEYSFLDPTKVASATAASPSSSSRAAAAALSSAQLLAFEAKGYLMGLPILSAAELQQVRRDFDQLLDTRTQRCEPADDEGRFRAAHTLAWPLHQELVGRLAQHPHVLRAVEDILGPRFVCWSAHLFCKLPGDPTQQPWHQDAGFWPLSASRALTLWLAFDDVDESNAGVTFVEGSHRLGRLPWQRTSCEHRLLTQEIPDVDLLGPLAPTRLRAGEATLHSDLTVHGSAGNTSTRRRAGLALRFVGSDADCLGPMLNGYRMNGGCILPKGRQSDPRGHWRALRRRAGGRAKSAAKEGEVEAGGQSRPTSPAEAGASCDAPPSAAELFELARRSHVECHGRKATFPRGLRDLASFQADEARLEQAAQLWTTKTMAGRTT